jgi:hypothetical protein
MAAVLKGHECTVHLLLQAGAAVGHRNKNGDSAIRSHPCTFACRTRSIFIFGAWIINLNCSVGVSSAFSALPALLEAIIASDTELLLQPNAKNVSPLHAACALSSPLAAVVVPQALNNYAIIQTRLVF